MNYLKTILLLSMAVLMAAMLSSCDDLVVENQNDPDRERALSSPGDIETLIQGTFRTYYYAGESYEPNIALSTAADELSSSWGNFGMQDISSEPRTPYDNDPSYGYSAVAEVPFANAYAAISAALDGLAAIEEGVDLGEDTARAQAFAQFVIGVSHAHVAAVHDQGFVVDKVPETTVFNPADSPFEIVPSEDVFQAGLDYMQTAIETAENADGFTIPSGWMGDAEFTKDEFVGIIKNYRAHYRASMPRTPEERENVDWQAVIDDIDEGYTEMVGGTFMIDDTPSENWFSGFRYYGKLAGWIRADYKTIGPADVSGNYQDWLDTNVQQRDQMLIETEDRRITGEDGPESAGKYISYSGGAPYPASRGTYHRSYYTYQRNIGTLANYQAGNQKWIFTQPTMRLLKAEALLHLDDTANKQEVVDIINETREDVGEMTPAELTDDTGSIDDSQSALDDASVWAKLKHEKRIESMGTAGGLAFFDRRGWGDLVDGTVEDLPIPGEELQILQEALYTSDVVGSTDKVSTDPE